MKSMVVFAALLATAVVTAVMTAQAPDYAAWDRVVSTHITLGSREGIPIHVVNYTAVAEDPDLPQFIKSLENIDVATLSKNETYAVFNNAYNALAINMMVQHACYRAANGTCNQIQSIKDIKSVTHPSVWTRPAGIIGGKSFALNDVEGYLRNPSPRFQEDCRVHSSIVCASISCPNVRLEAFTPEKIDEQMDDQMKDWLANPKKGSLLDVSNDTLYLSEIFLWFVEDFKACAGSVLDFIAPHVPNGTAAYIKEHPDVKIKYFDYDWNSNGPLPSCSGKC